MQFPSMITIILLSACRTDESDTLARVNQLEGQITSMQLQLDESETTISTLEETVSILNSALSEDGTLTDDLNSIHDRIDAVENSQQNQSNGLDVLDEKVLVNEKH